MKHVRTITDRTSDHIHRWVVKCSCGWGTIPLRSKKSMEEEWDRHQKGHTQKVARHAHSTWQRPTPQSKLPEILRKSP